MINYNKIKIGDVIESSKEKLYKVTYKSPKGERWVVRGRPLHIESRADEYEVILPLGGIERVIGQNHEDYKKYLEFIYNSYYKDDGENFEDMVERFATDDFYKAHEIAKKYLKR